MKVINVSDRIMYIGRMGNVPPGKATPDLFNDLEKVMKSVVDMCGSKFKIILNERELELIEKIVHLDEAGSKFDPSSIPESIRNDPHGIKRASDIVRNSQQKAIEKQQKKNAESSMREAIINGEIDENRRTPIGMATMKGEKVDPSQLKSGFESILEENKRIAEGKKRASVDEMLDPIGAHMEKDIPDAEIAERADPADFGNAEPVVQAKDLEGDIVRTVDADIPKPAVMDRASAMDVMAMNVANKLSIVGPDTDTARDNGDNAQDVGESAGKKGKGPRRGRGRKVKEA